MNTLQKLAKEDLSTSQIKKALDNKVWVMTYDKLKNFDTIDEALGPFKKLVILYLTKHNYGHFVCLWKFNETTIQFFDSFGDKVDRELKYIPKFFRHESGQEYPALSYLLLKSGYKIRYNQYKFQNIDNNTCGRWCIYRLWNSNLNEKQFANIFKGKKVSPDILVTYFTRNI